VYQFIENIKSDKSFLFYRGRNALYALLKAMRIGQSDEVIFQVFTCVHVPTPVISLGATSVYVDIDPGTFSIDPDKIEERITDKTRAIIVQHTFGIPAEMDRILDIARRYNLWVIEDCCHALGSRYSGQEVGTFGDAAFYSFGWHKPIVLGWGGPAVVNNPILKQKMKELHDDFVPPSLRKLIVLHIQYVIYNLLVTPALFSTMRDIYQNPRVVRLMAGIYGKRKTEISRDGQVGAPRARKLQGDVDLSYKKRVIAFQERRLFRKLDKFDSMVAHQKWVVSRYDELFSQTGYDLLELDGRFEPIYYKYPLLSDCKKVIFEKARQARIELSNMFRSPLYSPRYKANWESLGYRKGMCPISESVADRIVPLSVHSKIRAKEIERTIALLASFQ
jgi:dTDP-4-amino-4,6-dideoxygalactose transaminase